MKAVGSAYIRVPMLWVCPRSTACPRSTHCSRNRAFIASKLSATGIGTMKWRRT